MPDTPDPIKMIRASNPAEEAELGDHDSPQGRRLLAQILAQPRHQARADRRRWRRILILTAAAALLSAAAWVLLRPVTDPLGLTCYAAPDLESDRVALAAGTDLDPAACGQLWTNRTLTNQAIVAPGAIPELHACVSPSGGLAIFPNGDDQVCSRLGLADPDPASLPEAESLRHLADVLADRFGSVGCLSMDEAVAVVRRILDELGFREWTVVTTTTTPERQCASVAVDTANRTVVLVPIPE
ncbi:MAG: hypothetical protein ACRDWA_15365 [Acidimicrobiia bacterium]